MFNLSALNPNKSKPATLQLTNPYDGSAIADEKGNPVTITVHGMQSSVARNTFAELKKRGVDMTNEEAGAELLAALTDSWSKNLVTDLGELKCTPENAKALYLAEDWIAGQVLAFASDVANFAPKMLKA